MPSDATSAWWYGAADLKRPVFSHIAEARRGGRDLPLREFVKQFRNPSANAKAKAVCSRLPTISRLTDFEADEEAVHQLPAVMCDEAKPPSADILGTAGEAHFRTCFEAMMPLCDGGHAMRTRHPRTASRPRVNPHAAGLDLGSEEIWACVPDDRAAEPVRPFGPLPPDR